MKKLLALFLSLLLMLPALALAQEQQVLNILSWEGYVDRHRCHLVPHGLH